jgi:hypothetical protein
MVISISRLDPAREAGAGIHLGQQRVDVPQAHVNDQVNRALVATYQEEQRRQQALIEVQQQQLERLGEQYEWSQAQLAAAADDSEDNIDRRTDADGMFSMDAHNGGDEFMDVQHPDQQLQPVAPLQGAEAGDRPLPMLFQHAQQQQQYMQSVDQAANEEAKHGGQQDRLFSGQEMYQQEQIVEQFDVIQPRGQQAQNHMFFPVGPDQAPAGGGHILGQPRVPQGDDWLATRQ